MTTPQTHSAFVPVTGPALLDPLAKIAERNGFGVDRRGDAMVIDAPLGGVRFDPKQGGTQLTLSAASPAELQLLTDLYADRLAKLQLDVPVTWHDAGTRTPLNQIHATAIGALPLSPNFVRLRLAGNVTAFNAPNAGLHFRLALNRNASSWSVRDTGGRTVWPGGIENWHRPPYTVRRISEEGKWIDVDIVLHEGGRVTEWCDTVAPGDEVVLHGPSGSKKPTASWLGLIGDETALPVILRIIEDAPVGTRGQAFVATRHPDDAQKIKTEADIEVTWLEMRDDTTLIAALDQLIVPQNDHHIFFAAERSQAAAARTWLQANGLNGPNVKAASYWTR